MSAEEDLRKNRHHICFIIYGQLFEGRGYKSDLNDSGISTEFKSFGSLMELSKIQSGK